MRVTHVITRLVVGGAQENTISSVLGLRLKPNVEVDLISGFEIGREGSLGGVFDNHPDLLTRLPELVRPINPWMDWKAYRKLTTIFRERKPDIVHTHSGKAGIVGRLAASKAGVPVIIHTIHGPSFGNFQGAFSNWFFKRAELRAGRVTTHYVAVAEAMIKQYLKAGIGSPSEYTRIFSGFNLAPFLNAANDLALRTKLGLAEDDFVVGMVARLFKLKGHDELIDVASSLVKACPKMKFLLVGDGAWRDRLEERTRELQLRKHFVFTGLVRPEEVPQYIGIMDVLVHLSKREGLPRALPQAMAAGKPVIAMDYDGAKEVCIDGRTGFLLKPGDLSTLKKSLLQLQKTSGHAKSLGMNGRSFVEARFSEQTMVENIHELYLKLVENHARKKTA